MSLSRALDTVSSGYAELEPHLEQATDSLRESLVIGLGILHLGFQALTLPGRVAVGTLHLMEQILLHTSDEQ